MADLIFPVKGIDVATVFEEQPPDTTPTGQNVRAFEALTQRGRGGSRAGLKRYIPQQVSGANVIQDINIIVDPFGPGWNEATGVTGLGVNTGPGGADGNLGEGGFWDQGVFSIGKKKKKYNAAVQATIATAITNPFTPGLFTIQINPTTPNPITVNFSISGTAVPGIDYTAITPTNVVIPGGFGSATVAVNPTIFGTDGSTVVLTLLPGMGYNIGNQPSATVTISNPPAVSTTFGQTNFSNNNGLRADNFTATWTFPLAFNSPVSTGSLLVLIFSMTDVDTIHAQAVASCKITGVNDSLGQTWIPAAPLITVDWPTQFYKQQAIYYFANTAGGPNTVTVTVQSSLDPSPPSTLFTQSNLLSSDMRLLEFGGIKRSLRAMKQASGTGLTASAGTLTNPLNDLVIASCAHTNMNANTVTSPLVLFTDALVVASGEAYTLQSAVNQSADFTGPSGTNQNFWVASIVAFKKG